MYKVNVETYDGDGDETYLFHNEKNARVKYESLKEEYKDDNSFDDYGDSFGVDGIVVQIYQISTQDELQKPLVYLASTYTHEDPNVVEERFRKVSKKAADLANQGMIVFSPIAMCHPMAVYGKLPGDWGFWEKFDRAYLSCCNKMIVYKIEGWEKSRGVQAEIKIAQEMSIPIEYIEE